MPDQNGWMYRNGWGLSVKLDQSDIPKDPSIPWLSQLLDAGQFSSTIAGSTVLNGLKIRSCEIASVAYRPGQECRVNYRVAVENGSGLPMESRLVCAKTMANSVDNRHLSKRCDLARNKGIDFAYIPNTRLWLTCFPQDMRIRTLPRLVKTAKLERAVRPILESKGLTLTRDARDSLNFEILSYRPERSCLFKLSCICERTHLPRSVFVRVYRHSRVSRIHDLMMLAWDSAHRKSGKLILAEPLGFHRRNRLLVQSEVHGTPMSDAAGFSELQSHFRQVGSTLAALHSVPVGTFDANLPLEKLDWLKSNAKNLASVEVELSVRMSGVVDMLLQRLPALCGSHQCFVHGDFSTNQVLVSGSGVGIIDFDDAGFGDIHADLGTFLARMNSLVTDDAMRVVCRSAFLSEYKAEAGTSVNEAKLAWFEAYAIVRLALSSISHLRRGWRSKAETFLKRAEICVQIR